MMMVYSRLAGFLGRQDSFAWIAVLTMVLYLPYLFVGLIGDDFYHYANINGALKGIDDGHWLLGLFRFVDDNAVRTRALIEQGMLPWWTAPSFQFEFFRPLTALTHFIDYGPFAGSAFLAHLHSQLWMLVSLAAVYFCTLQMGVGRMAALLALLVFAVDSTHAMTVGWLSNRSALIACGFGLFGMGFYLRHIEHRNARSLLAALVLLALALIAGEIAIAIAAMMVGYVLLVADRPFTQKLIVLMPVLVLVLCYLLFYRVQGFGAGGDQNLYLDPMKESELFLPQMLARVPVLAFGALGLVPADVLAANLSPLAPQVIICLAALLLLVVLMWRELRADRRLVFLFLAIIVCSIPVAAKLPADRNLYVVSYPVAVLVALILEKALNGSFLGGSLRQRSGKLLAGFFLVFNVLLSAVLVPVWGLLLKQLSDESRLSAQTIAALDGGIGGKTLVMVNTPFMVGAMVAPVMYYLGLELPRSTYWVSGVTKDLSISYDDDGQLLLAAPQGMVATADEQMFRDPSRAPMTVEEHHEFRDIAISIEAVSSKHLPTQLKLELNPRLPADQFVVLEFKDGQPRIIPRGTRETATP